MPLALGTRNRDWGGVMWPWMSFPLQRNQPKDDNLFPDYPTPWIICSQTFFGREILIFQLQLLCDAQNVTWYSSSGSGSLLLPPSPLLDSSRVGWGQECPLPGRILEQEQLAGMSCLAALWSRSSQSLPWGCTSQHLNLEFSRDVSLLRALFLCFAASAWSLAMISCTSTTGPTP